MADSVIVFDNVLVKNVTLPVVDAFTAIEKFPGRFSFFQVVPGGANVRGVLNIYDFMTAVEQIDAQNWASSYDLTGSFNAMIAAMPTTGARITIPAGRYFVASAINPISVPFLIEGAGTGAYDLGAGGQNAGSVITTNNTTAQLLTITAEYGKFRDICFFNSGVATAGSAVFVNHPTSNVQRVDFDNVGVFNFFDGLDIAVGTAWQANVFIVRNKRYGVRIRNVITADAGDWTLTGYIAPQGGGIGVQIESSGGGKIHDMKILADATAILSGIVLNGGGVTTQLLVVNCDIEICTGPCINCSNGWPSVQIKGCYLKNSNAVSGTAAVNLSHCNEAILLGNEYVVNGTNIISIDHSVGVLIEPTLMATGVIVDNGSNSFIMDMSNGQLAPCVVSKLPDGTQPAMKGMRGFVTDSTVVAAANFGATVAGTGANLVPVYCDGTASWKIG